MDRDTNVSMLKIITSPGATFSDTHVSIRVYRRKMLTKKKIVVVIGIIVAILISFYTGVFGISTAA